MGALILQFPAASNDILATARLVIRGHFPDAVAQDACTYLKAHGDWIDREQATSLERAIAAEAKPVRRWFIRDAIGLCALIVMLWAGMMLAYGFSPENANGAAAWETSR